MKKAVFALAFLLLASVIEAEEKKAENEKESTADSAIRIKDNEFLSQRADMFINKHREWKIAFDRTQNAATDAVRLLSDIVEHSGELFRLEKRFMIERGKDSFEDNSRRGRNDPRNINDLRHSDLGIQYDKIGRMLGTKKEQYANLVDIVIFGRREYLDAITNEWRNIRKKYDKVKLFDEVAKKVALADSLAAGPLLSKDETKKRETNSVAEKIDWQPTHKLTFKNGTQKDVIISGQSDDLVVFKKQDGGMEVVKKSEINTMEAIKK